jgi:hypothetical protein
VLVGIPIYVDKIDEPNYTIQAKTTSVALHGIGTTFGIGRMDAYGRLSATSSPIAIRQGPYVTSVGAGAMTLHKLRVLRFAGRILVLNANQRGASSQSKVPPVRAQKERFTAHNRRRDVVGEIGTAAHRGATRPLIAVFAVLTAA